MEVPSEGTVFEHFFNLSEGMMGDTSNPINCSRSKSPQMVYTTVPQVSPPNLPTVKMCGLTDFIVSRGWNQNYFVIVSF